MLKPQDIVILLKIMSTMTLTKGYLASLSQNKLATLLCMSTSEVNAGIKRLVLSGLMGPMFQGEGRQKELVFLPIKSAYEECLISGVKYFFPAEFGTYTRGIPTSYAAPIFKKHIILGNDPIPVWPYAEDNHSNLILERGIALEPLYRSVPESLATYPDNLFYEMLVLVDAIRAGRARERDIAIKLLKERINHEQ